MNERFRFRVWDIENRRYAEFIYENFYEYLTMPNRCVVEQCTGLKDKNGKLIYEGDILKLPWQAGWQPLVVVVKFNKLYASFLASLNPIEEPEKSFWYNDNKEVIGNIHENPELLKEKGKKYE